MPIHYCKAVDDNLLKFAVIGARHKRKYVSDRKDKNRRLKLL